MSDIFPTIAIPILNVPGSGGGSGSIDVNGSPVTNPNFNGTTPAAPTPLSSNVTFQVSGSDISAYEYTNWYDVRNFGVVGDGSDQTTAMQAAIDGTPDFSTLFIPPNFTIGISSTLNIHLRQGLHLYSPSYPGSSSNGNFPAEFTWLGAAGGTVIDVNRSRGCWLEGFVVRTDHHGNGANVAINVDQSIAGTTICSDNLFDKLAIWNDTPNANFVGIYFSATSLSNVEAMSVTDCIIQGTANTVPGASDSGSGIRLGFSFNQKGMQFLRVSIAQCSIAYNLGYGSEIYIQGGLLETNYTDVYTSQIQDLLYQNIRSENVVAAPFVLDSGGGSGNLIVENCEVAALRNAGSIFTLSGNGGRLTIIGGAFSEDMPAGTTTFNEATDQFGWSVFISGQILLFDTPNWAELSGNDITNGPVGRLALVGAAQYGLGTNQPVVLLPCATAANDGNTPVVGTYLDLAASVSGNSVNDHFYLQNLADAIVFQHAGPSPTSIALDTALSSLSVPVISTPVIAASFATGATGSTSYSYKIVGRDILGHTAASTVATIANGHATLDSTNKNVLEWFPVLGVTYFDIYRTASGGTPSSTGLIGTIPAALLKFGAIAEYIFTDTGLAGDSTIPPTTNTTGQIQGVIINATTGFQVAGAAPSGQFLRGNGTDFVASAIQTSDLPPVLWSDLGNATADLVLANAGFKTTFGQTSAVAWKWANTTAAAHAAPQSSPLIELSGQYWKLGSSTQIASDNFNRADGGLGANWTQFGNSNLVIVSNAVASDEGGGNPSAAYWNANSFANDQYSQATVLHAAGTGSGGSGVTVRWVNGVGGYAATFHGSTWDIRFLYSNGNATLLTSGSGTFADNDVIKLQIIGSTLTLFQNGTSIGTTTDTTYVSGHPGMYDVSYALTSFLDDWSGGNVTADATVEDLWSIENVVGSTDTTGPSTLQFIHTGSTGAPAIQFPSGSVFQFSTDLGLSRLGAASMAIGNGTQGNTTGNLSLNRINLAGADFAGQATVTAGNTTKAVSFAANYTGAGQPVIVLTPTSDPLAAGVPVGYWVTYSGSTGAWTGFTVNIQTALAGDVTFNYVVIGQA